MSMIGRIVQMQHVLAAIDSSATPAYFAEYMPAPGLASAAIAEVDPKDIPGLMFYYHVESETGQVRIATAWRSREFYLRETDRLRTILQAPAATVHGYIARSAVPGKPFWKRQSLLTLLLAFTSVLGALEVVRNHFSYVFEPPSLILKNERPAELTEGSEFFERMELLNELPIAHRDVTLSGMWTAGGAAVATPPPLQVTPLAIAYLAPGAKHDIEISGTAPRYGKYEMRFEVHAKAGYLAGRRPFRFTRAVTVWPKLPVGSIAVHTVQDRNRAILRGKLSVGVAAEHGLECQLTFRGSPGLQYADVLDFPGMSSASVRWMRSSEALPDEVASLQWNVQPVPARSIIPFKFALSRSANTDWNQVAQRSSVNCFYLEEKPK